MKMGKKKASAIGIVALALMISMAVGLFMQRSGLTPKSFIVFAVNSNPDSFGNKINFIKIRQDLDESGTFIDSETVVYITTDNYTEGMTVEIDANYYTQIYVQVLLNKTLATDIADAADKTRVYYNVSSTAIIDQLGTMAETESDTDFYMVDYSTDPCFTPDSDTVYSCTVEYEAYY